MSREARLARNEAIFREVNERIAELSENWVGDEFHIVCECATVGCQSMLGISLEDYRAVREHPLRFIVAPGHTVSDIEDLVERRGDFEVVEKHAELAAELQPSPHGG
jgi:hypothetical protein